MLSTDYLLWTNWQKGTGERAASCLSAGARILELARVDPSPYFAWLGEETEERLLLRFGSLWLDGGGNAAEADGEMEAFWRALDSVAYDLLEGEGYLAGRLDRVGPADG